ncbi:MAG: hypothetical protein ACU85E_01040 [Gammaproteobacteria bacterium]
MAERNNDKEPKPLWEFVPLNEYNAPSPPMAYRVKGGITGLWQKLKPAETKPESPLSEDDVLKFLPDRIKRSILPTPNWHPAALALDKTLESNGQDHEHTAVVAPPCCDDDAILKNFAGIRNWRLIEPPSNEQVLSGDIRWLDTLTNTASPWVLPNLEKCYLRHHRGLALVRQLFIRLQRGTLQPGVIGCDSWAWAFFQQLMPELLPPSFALQALDHLKLARWLRDLTLIPNGRQISFRQSDNGEDVLPLASRPISGSENIDASYPFLKELASYSRGIPGIALSIWSGALRSLPEQTPRTAPPSNTKTDELETVWLPPWKQLNLAKPSGISVEQHLVLHNLLLHSSLANTHLPSTLPFSAIECNRAVSALKNANLIELQSDQWRVKATAYPAVRQLLHDRGYLIDAF